MEQDSKAGAYKRLFDSEDGAIVLQDLLNAGYVRQPVIDTDPIMMAYKEGHRNAVLRIIALAEKPLTVE